MKSSLVQFMATLFRNLFKSPLNTIHTIVIRSKGYVFPQYQNLPPYHPINGTGSSYATKIERKRQIKDINVPNFEKREALNWTDWRMLRDCRRRHIFARYHPTRNIFLSIYRTQLLPSNIRVSFRIELLMRSNI